MMEDSGSKNIIRIVALIALFAGLLWFVMRISWVIKLCMISLLIVYVLFPIVEYLKKRFRFSHFFAVVLTFLFFVMVIVALASVIVPVVQSEIRAILRDFPFYLRQLQRYIGELSEFLQQFDLDPGLMSSFSEVSSNLQPLLENITTVSFSLISSIADIFFVLLIVFYLLYDFHHVRKAALKVIPSRYEKCAEDVLRIIDINIGVFIRGNIVRCTIVGLLTGFILYAFSMPYSLLLGILAGVLNIILVIGPYLAAIPAILLSFSPQAPSTIIVIAIYIIVQTIDGVVLSPLLLGRAVKVKPITIIISLLIGEQLAGILGMIISTPIAGIIKGLREYARNERTKTM
jgi:predicted PurR-regulated permease PerM